MWCRIDYDDTYLYRRQLAATGRAADKQMIDLERANNYVSYSEQTITDMI